MGTTKKRQSQHSKTPIYIGIIMLAVSALIYFIVKTVSSSSCAGNAICFILLPALLPAQLLPAFPLAYGISLFIAFFYHRGISNKKYEDKDVYNLAFKIFIISGIILATIPWLLALL